MNRQLFLEWFPQIMYNHHQTGPAGAVMFAPPFRDPFNYNFDPLIPLQIEMVGAAMHSRLVAEGKPGTVQRSGASYSTWYNGGLRTATYFHNMIGLLTETIGNPTPMEVPLVPDRQLPTGDEPFPVPPQTWHFRTVDRIFHDRESRGAGSGFQISRRLSLQHLPHGAQFHRARQPGFVDRHAQAHRGARRGRRPRRRGAVGRGRGRIGRLIYTRYCTIPRCAIRAATSCLPISRIFLPPPSSSIL